MEGTVVKARAIFCPNCGATVSIRGFAHTLNVSCQNCLSVLDPNTPSVTLLQKIQQAQKIDPKIPMGSRGVFENTSYEAIGFQRRGIEVDGITYTWDEYLLFHPYKGFRYLSEYNGHWNFIKPLQALPQRNGQMISVAGRTFKHFQAAVAQTFYVVGEFPWQVRVGDAVNVDDFIAPPMVLSSERTADEVNWSMGEYIDGKDVWKAFGLTTPAPSPSGVYANQPNPHGSLWRMYLMFTLVMLFISMVSCLGKGNKVVFDKRYQFVPSSNAEPSFVTEIFELGGSRNAATDVEVIADVSNNWLTFAIALINEQTGEAFDFGKDLSYYSGVDGGESWTEGGKSFTVTVPEVPPGRYYLRVEPDRDKQPDETDEQFSKLINYEIIVRHDIPAYGMFYLVWFLWSLPPIWVWIRKAIFEQRRWAESDYAPASSE
jgi:hypothetical protein